jgi:hypothetical protein
MADVATLATGAVLIHDGAPEACNGKRWIGKALVERGQAVDIDLHAARQDKMDVDFEQAAVAVAPVEAFDDMAGVLRP